MSAPSGMVASVMSIGRLATCPTIRSHPYGGMAMSSLRGRILHYHRAVQVAPGVTAHGVKPRIVVYVKTGSRRLRDDWDKACRHRGLYATVAQSQGEDRKGNAFVTVFDVTGSPDALESLTQRPCVKEWHFVLDVPIPFRGPGSSDKDKCKRVMRPIDERLVASVQYAMRNDKAIASAKLPTLEHKAALGIVG